MLIKDYYDILKVPKDCTDAEIKKSYRKLAMIYHPDKNQDNEAAKTFQDIAESYLVLSNYEKRQLYDQLGYEGFIDKMDDSDDEIFKQNPQDTFESFFGSRNPFASFEFGSSHADLPKKDGPKKGPNIIHQLECSLSELYNGCIKTYQIVKKLQQVNDGPIVEETKTLTINVKQGWKNGTTVIFTNEGDHLFDTLPSDVVFVVEQKDYVGLKFMRDGNNLIYYHQISLCDALLGGVINISTLDDRILSIACPEIVFPDYQKLVPDEGMPLTKSPEVRGNLVIKFNIIFPKHLSLQKRQKLKEVLGSDI